MTTAAQHNAILHHFTERAKNYGLKPGTKKFLDAQAHYFCGVMATLSAVNGEALDPGITISIMSGRVIESRVATSEELASKTVTKLGPDDGREPFAEPKAVDQRGIVFEPPLTPNHEPRFTGRRIPFAPNSTRYVAVKEPSSGKCIYVKFGESGYFPTVPRGGYSCLVDAETEDSYRAGSMFGWDCPAAQLAVRHHNEPAL